MNKFTFLFILLASAISAQEALIPHEKEGKWGYISFDTKKVVVPYQYSLAEEFMDNGIAKVKLGEKWGLLDSDGKELVPVKYDYIYTRKYNAITRFNLNGKWGLFDAEFNTILPAKYEMIHDFQRHYIVYDKKNYNKFEKKKLIYFKAKKEGKWGVIDIDDQVVLSFKYDDITYIQKSTKYSLHLASPKESRLHLPGPPLGRCGMTLPPPVSKNFFLVRNGNQGKIITSREKVVYTFEDYHTDWKLRPVPATLYTSRDGKAKKEIFVVHKNKKMGVVSAKGKLVLPFEYEEISYQYNNILHVKKGDKYGIATTDGDLLQPPIYDQIYGHEVILNEKHGILKQDYKSLLFPIGLDKMGNNNSRDGFYAENGLIHVQKNEEEGLLDYQGNIVFPLSKQTIQFTRNGLLLEKDNRWGMINYQQTMLLKQPTLLLEIAYDTIFTNKKENGFFVVKKNQQFGVWSNRKKDWTLPLEYDSIIMLPNYEMQVQKNNKWGIINANTGEVVKIKYDEIKQYKGRIGDQWETLPRYKREQAQVDRRSEIKQQGIQERDGKYGIIGEDGTWLLPPEYQKIKKYDQAYQMIQDDKMGIIDAKGTFIIEPQYEEIYYDSKYDFIKAKQDKKWGVISRENNIIVPFQYTVINGFRNNILKLFDGTYYKMVDLKGKEISKSSYTDISNINTYLKSEPYLIQVSKAYRKGIIDEKGNIVLPCNFQSVKPENRSIKLTKIPELFPVKVNDKWGYAHKNGEIIIPFQFSEVSYFHKNIAIVKKENKYFLMDHLGHLLTKKGYHKVVDFNPNAELAIVMNEQGKQGAVNSKGTEIIPLIYDKLKTASGIGKRFYYATLNDQYGVIDNQGKILIPLSSDKTNLKLSLGMIVGKHSSLRGLDRTILLNKSYDDARNFYKNYYIVKKNGKAGIVDILTQEIIIPIKYRDILPRKYHQCSMDYFVVQKGEKVGLVDQSNSVILPFEYESIHPSDHLNLLMLRKDGKTALADMQGNLITGFEYEEIFSTRFPPFPAKKNGKWGYIDTTGKIIYPFELESGNRFYAFYKNRIIVVKNSPCSLVVIPDSIQIQASIAIAGKPFWLSTDGKLTEKATVIRGENKTTKTKVTQNVFKTFNPVNRSQYLVDENGKKILPYSFLNIYQYCSGFIPFDINGGKNGFYLPSSKKAVQYNFIQRSARNNAPIRWVKNDDKFGFINNKGKEITPLHFERVGEYQEEAISVFKDGKMGFLDETGALKIPLKYEDDGNYKPFFEKGVAYAYLNGKYGFISPAGKTLAPFEYEAIAYFKDGVAIAYRNGKWEELVF